MTNKLKNRKGATLAELMIVLAVVVIAAGMVVTFSSMMHGAQGVSNARYEALQDVKVAEALIEGVIENNVYKMTSIEADRIKYQAVENGENGETVVEREIYFAPSKALITGENEVIFLENIDSINFKYEKAENDEDIIFYCTIKYSVSDTPYTYTFCVNPYIGEGGN